MIFLVVVTIVLNLFKILNFFSSDSDGLFL